MKEQVTEVILIGDAGAPNIVMADPVMDMFKAHLPDHDQSAVVFLGDNIYPNGLPSEHDIRRPLAEKRLKIQLDIVKDFKGKLVFLSGNHDWNVGRTNGFEYVIRQEKFIENYFGGRDVFVPSGGCPGPVEVPVNDYLTIIAINTQWWVQFGYRPMGSQCGCNTETETQVFDQLNDMIKRNRGKRVLVVGHMPMYSYGAHGGRFKAKHHLFPLTLFKRKAFIPMPVIGSVIAFYRRFIGIREDLAHPRYRRLRNQLKAVLKKYPDAIYAAGHEHNLQHIQKYGNHYIVSGSGSKLQTVNHGKYAHFVAEHKGFFKLRIDKNFSVDAEAWAILDGKPAKLYSAKLY